MRLHSLCISCDSALTRVRVNHRWETIYPIYLDTKQPQQDGARRVSKQVGLEWPLAEQIAKACRMMGFETVFEVSDRAPYLSVYRQRT